MKRVGNLVCNPNEVERSEIKRHTKYESRDANVFPQNIKVSSQRITCGVTEVFYSDVKVEVKKPQLHLVNHF